ncbi:DUF2267 domain-containing protein [Streptomyces sp. SCSIO 75703]|uniref:DUF2267 domain-containing protein n=1 Tax=unclassified Streptomyces TaxID=2593676 RepID=UPI0004C249F6|nr:MULTISPECIES: DUF2267 domain-containing protein [unclassified Streptomyces]
MQSQTAPAAVSSTPDTSYARMLEQVRYQGAYPTRERAEEVVRAVLTALGRRLAGEVRADLAACLPAQAARVLTAPAPAPGAAPTGWGFVRDLAARTGGSPATTRWDVGSVLGVVARLAGPDVLDRVLASLPQGYALLFGRGELTQAAA